MTYTEQYLDEAVDILKRLDGAEIERMVDCLIRTREQNGRLFILGVGGGAGHASHAVCDFRKIALIVNQDAMSASVRTPWVARRDIVHLGYARRVANRPIRLVCVSRLG